MFIWWSDPYVWMTVVSVILTVTLALWLLLIRVQPARRRMWATVALAALWLCSICPWLYLTERIRKTADGERQSYPAPDISAKLENGRPITLADFRGNVVLLDFWATWCAPCHASEPAVEHLVEAFNGEDFVLLRVSGDENAEAWRRYIASHPSNALEALDESSSMARVFGVRGRPEFILIDKDDMVRWKQSSWTPYSYFFLRHALTQLLA